MQRIPTVFSRNMALLSQIKMTGERGSGAGRGGGGGGSIRDAGGSFGKMEAAHEDQYFYNLQKEQISKLKEGLHDEISFHEEQIKRHQEAINRHKKRIGDMEKNK
ncbi:ATPase inhibitor mai-2, mitochondrial-like [Phymastichus coffea]|uniref:ATPase inhibitor mai-2, mitochondrial-like n=1 Tax=Phymastichus coffea TaxID=108790 RepID=UPI00273B5F6D|nr:ATPase inhibitor mai-2, mitochondrial-like [Phymastichus coffea]